MNDLLEERFLEDEFAAVQFKGANKGGTAVWSERPVASNFLDAIFSLGRGSMPRLYDDALPKAEEGSNLLLEC